MPYFVKKLLIEISLFLSMIALAGNVTAIFWERYVVQNKLTDMKESLNHLKVTVHNMGYAYDDLQRDLIDLARINSKASNPTPPKQEPIPCKKRRGLDDKALEHLNLLYTNVAKENDKARHLLIADKSTGSYLVPNEALAKNAATLTRLPLKATAVGSAVIQEHPNQNECIHKCRASNNIRRCYEDCESANFQRF